MSSLQFIKDTILTRLVAGQFVAERRSKAGSITLADRRNLLSPLAIGKRCIRYEPQVFANRRDLLIQMAEGLNNPVQKMLLVTGAQGAGKTSLVRGLVEMMGGGQEQLLWFDVTVHTDFEEITQFLIQYLNYIATNLRIAQSDAGVFQAEGQPEPLDPAQGEQAMLEQLGRNLEAVSHVPLLIVLDNIEYLVDPEYQLQSFSFKEILNFLLSFPHIKMVLIGERLPYGDISVDAQVIQEIKLTSLPEAEALSLMLPASAEPVPEREREAATHLLRKAAGMPWQLRMVQFMARLPGMSFAQLDALPIAPGAAFTDTLIQFIYERLSVEERAVLNLLSLLRHPVDRKTLYTLLRACSSEEDVLSTAELDRCFDKQGQSLLKPLLKKIFPPQVVLAQVRRQLETAQSVQSESWFELANRQIKKAVHKLIDEDTRDYLHGQLQAFYLQERNTPFEKRIYRIKSKALLAEAAFHANIARKRRLTQETDSSLESRTYTYRTQAQSPPEKRPTLEDYRKISMPEVPIASAGSPVRPPRSDTQPTQTVEGVMLSPEERTLVGEDVPAASVVRPGEPRGMTSPRPSDKAIQPMPFYQILMETAATSAGDASTESLPHVMAEAMTAEAWEREARQFVAGEVEETSADSPDAPSLETELVLAVLDRESADEIEQRLQQDLLAAVATGNRADGVVRLIDLARYRSTLGQFHKAEQCLEIAMTWQAEAPLVAKLEGLTLYGRLCKETHRLAEASRYFQQAEALLPAMQESTVIAAAQQAEWRGRVDQALGEVALAQDQFQEAIRRFGQAARHYAQAGQPLKEAEALFWVGETYDNLGVVGQALSYYGQSLQLDRSQGNHLSCAATLVNMGTLYLQQGNLPKAIAHLEESLHYDKLVDNRSGQYNTLETLARVYRSQQNWTSVEAAYVQALGLALKEGNPYWQTSAYVNLGNLHATRSDWSKALDFYLAAQKMAPADLPEQNKAFIHHKIQEARSHVPSP